MTGKQILGIMLMVLGALSLFLNGWLFLLTNEIRPLLFVCVGAIIVFAGWRNYQQATAEKRKNDL